MSDPDTWTFGEDTDQTQAITMGDMDGDGDLDVVVGNVINQNNLLYLNDGDGDPFNSLTNGLQIGTYAGGQYGVQSFALGVVDGGGGGGCFVNTLRIQ